MSSGNRVELLETRVTELEATVQGLTEELVQANERIRQIEIALGGKAEATAPGDDGKVLKTPGWGMDTAAGSQDPADAGEGVEFGSESGSDAEADASGAEADKSGGTDGGDEGELDDIIVA